MFKLLAVVVYRSIQIVLFPFALIGYVVFVIKTVAHSRRSGAAATVLASLYVRYMEHKLGTRNDEPAARLMHVMTSVSQTGLVLLTTPTLVAHDLTGYVPRVYRYPYEGIPPMKHQPSARTTYYDDAVTRAVRDGVDQVVILGAGFDTRAYRLRSVTRVHWFEIDQPKTQAFKREMLIKANIDPGRTRFITADFERDDWFAQLATTDFDARRRSLFIWESVTMYLDREAVMGTLQRIARAAAGSAVAFDYVSTELLESPSLFMRYSRAIINATGEPWRFGLDNSPPARQHVADFVAACGLTLREYRNFGEETATTRPLAGFAIASVGRE
jgi:methyltransferase (TIGR00027 family)